MKEIIQGNLWENFQRRLLCLLMISLNTVKSNFYTKTSYEINIKIKTIALEEFVFLQMVLIWYKIG